MTKRTLSGFTLIEVLASVAMFTVVIGVLFSAIAAMQRTDLFRRDNVAVTQAANFAFEPIIQRLKEADAKETLQTGQGCVTVQGYYATHSNESLVPEPLISGDMYHFSNGAGRLVVITAEKDFGSQGSSRKWQRRDYFVRTNSQNSAVKTLVEKTYNAVTEWPTALSCDKLVAHWQEAANGNRAEVKELTANDINVDNFDVSFIVATLPSTGKQGEAVIKQRAPFITISLTVSKPKSKVAKPTTLRTTLTPTFSYGETRE